MRSLEEIRYVTRNFQALQGLRVVPFGVLILLYAPDKLGLAGWPRLAGNLEFALVFMLLAVGLWFGLNRYYEHMFGRVTPQARLVWENLLPLFVLVVLVIVIVVEVALSRQWNGLQISPIELALAVVYLALGLVEKRWYYTVFGGALLGVSALPLLTGTNNMNGIYGTFGFVFCLVFGAGVVAAGVLDHFRLVRAFHGHRQAAL